MKYISSDVQIETRLHKKGIIAPVEYSPMMQYIDGMGINGNAGGVRGRALRQ